MYIYTKYNEQHNVPDSMSTQYVRFHYFVILKMDRLKTSVLTDNRVRAIEKQLFFQRINARPRVHSREWKLKKLALRLCSPNNPDFAPPDHWSFPTLNTRSEGEPFSK